MRHVRGNVGECMRASATTRCIYGVGILQKTPNSASPVFYCSTWSVVVKRYETMCLIPPVIIDDICTVANNAKYVVLDPCAGNAI